MLQQMLLEDKCDQVRCACSKSLAMVINEIDDESRLSQVDTRILLLMFIEAFPAVVYRITGSMSFRYTRCRPVGQTILVTFDCDLVSGAE